MANMLQTERLLLSNLKALSIKRLINGEFCQLQREGRLVNDPICHCEGGVEQLVARNDVVDHAQAMRLFGIDRIAGKQEFLGLADT